MGATAAQREALRRHIARLERAEVVENAHVPLALAFGVAAVDEALPAGGLAGGRLHELRGGKSTLPHKSPGSGAPATAVTAALAGRQVRQSGKAVAWIAKPETLFLPGLAAYGLKAQDLIVVTPQDDTDALWAAEECLRSGSFGCVVAEIAELSLTASRRLQLAAEIGGCTGLLLRGDGGKGENAIPPTVCVTSWQVTGLPGSGLPGSALPGAAGLKPHLMGPARWALDLQRCRNGVPQSWNLEWCDDTGGFRLAAEVRHGPMVATPATGLARAS